jgi:serine/threonine protein phosphatase PrpC
LGIESDGSWDEELIAFGTTLLCCCGNDKGLLGFQLGDGDMVCSQEGTHRFLFAESTELMGTVTHSLCQPFKQNQSMLAWVDNTDFEMVFLTTDGLRDCMQGDRKHFDTVIPWIQKIIRENPESLPTWLQKISTQGNGDDISIALYSPHSLYGSTGDPQCPCSK